MVDFQRLMTQLNERGWSDERVAQKTGVTRQALYALRIGKNKEPRYSVGKALVDLERRTRRRK